MTVEVLKTRRTTSGRKIFVQALVLWNPLLAAAITFVLSGTRGFFEDAAISLVIAEAVLVQCFGFVFFVAWAERRIARVRDKPEPVHGEGRWLVLSGLAMPFALPVAYAASGAAAGIFGIALAPPDFRSYRIGFGFGAVMLLLFFLQRSRTAAKEVALAAETKIKDLETARLRAQLAALTAEMNPHLLFNALNTVAALVHKDPDLAEDVVLELSDLYRGVLRASGAATHPLREELALCEAYLKIERARFGERLAVEITVDPAVDPGAVVVPVLVVQPFVENAVKHGLASRARGGKVTLDVGRDGARIRIRVDDDGVGLGRSKASGGAGKAIANCRERLGLTYGDAARVDVGDAPGGGVRVEVVVPEVLAEVPS